MLFEISTFILVLMLPCFFLLGFGIGARKANDPTAPLIPKKPRERTPDRMEQLSRNISNYTGDSTNQVPIKDR